jgi:hypothetical protein
MIKREQHPAVPVTAERRAEPRIQTSHSVLFRTPDTVPIEACVLDVSSSGARLRSSEPVPVGARVRVETEELLLCGSVTRCEPTHGAYDAGIARSRPLEMLGELRKLNVSLLAKPEPF